MSFFVVWLFVSGIIVYWKESVLNIKLDFIGKKFRFIRPWRVMPSSDDVLTSLRIPSPISYCLALIPGISCFDWLVLLKSVHNAQVNSAFALAKWLTRESFAKYRLLSRSWGENKMLFFSPPSVTNRQHNVFITNSTKHPNPDWFMTNAWIYNVSFKSATKDFHNWFRDWSV